MVRLRPFLDDLVAGLTWRGMAILAVVLGGSLAGGFLVGLSGFAVNLLAGVVGLVIAIVAGILFIDRLPDRRREREWSRVREQTLQLLHSHLNAFAMRCWMEGQLKLEIDSVFFQPLGPDRPRPTRLDVDVLQQLAVLVRDGGPDGKIPAIDILRESRWDLTQITDVYVPRVMSLSSDIVLVERLQDFSRSVSRAQLALYLEDPEGKRTGQGYKNQIAWDPIAEALEASARVFEHLMTG